MSELIWQGLSLSCVGLSLTFSGLGLLILVIILLQRVFQTRPLVPEDKDREERPLDSTMARDRPDEEVVAAIAIALAHLHLLNVSQGRLGTSLEAGHGPWWAAGRAQQHTPVRRQTGGTR